ncbi:hypothetical protein F383_13086 [Gossypium arboreum]|uniref:Uncharacterized protein n=1 Tax=Gossypium arboreum TaxID=29729 RepID=A0A0B0Q115_GOSAR|nr:hypothetical protein F383_13086 [Gossypium arboreum]
MLTKLTSPSSFFGIRVLLAKGCNLAQRCSCRCVRIGSPAFMRRQVFPIADQLIRWVVSRRL